VVRTSRGIVPEPVCYESVVTAYSRRHDKEGAVEALRDLEARGKPVGRAAYTSAIAACQSTGDWEAAWALYTRMRARGLEPSPVTRAAVLNILVEARRWGEASEVAREEMAADDGEATPLSMKHDLLAVYSHQEEFVRVTELFREVRAARAEQGLAPPWQACNLAVQAVARTGDFGLGFDILEVSVGCCVSEESRFVRHVGGCQLLRQHDMAVDVVMCGCVLTACAAGAEWRRAFALLKDMVDRGLAPNLICYTRWVGI
jgi:pentatricopeptide repeat protein